MTYIGMNRNVKAIQGSQSVPQVGKIYIHTITIVSIESTTDSLEFYSYR